MVAGVVSRAGQLDSTLDEAQVTVAVTQRDVIWNQPFLAEQWRIMPHRQEGIRAKAADACA